MNSASYPRGTCRKCCNSRYIDGMFPYNLHLYKVKECWHEMRDRVVNSRYLVAHSGICLSCRSVARAHTLVMVQLLYKLGLLDRLEIEI